MNFFIFKLIVSALIIAFTSWLSGRNPFLAGLIIALPLMTLISSIFSYVEYKNSDATIHFVKSIFFVLPLGWLFFLPFMVADKFNFHFWTAYGLGVSLLVTGFILMNSFKQYFMVKPTETIHLVHNKSLEKERIFSFMRKQG